MTTKIPASKRLNNQLDKYDRILDAAYSLFLEQGFEEVSIQEIAERANVAKGTFYLYFPDKDSLRDELITRKSNELFQLAIGALHQTNIATFEGQIIFIVDYITNILDENRDILKLIAKNLSFGLFNHKINELIVSDDIDIIQSLTLAAERSGVRLKNPQVLLFMIIELTSSTCFSCILEGEPLEFAIYKPYLFDAIRQIIRSQQELD